MNYNTNIEIWKDIKGYEGLYQISNLGRVKSLERKVNNNGTLINKKSRIMKSSINPSGYLTVRLRKDGKSKTMFIHKMIAISFIDNIENKKEVNHIDHNKLNNDISNLEWCTRKENMQAMSIFYSVSRIKKEIKNKCQCGNVKCRNSKTCIKCSRLKSRKVKERPTSEELRELTNNHSFLYIGKIFNVSDNAVRKWCKEYGIEHRKRFIK